MTADRNAPAGVNRPAHLAVRRTLLELLRTEAAALALPGGMTMAQLRSELDALESSLPEQELTEAGLLEQMRILAGLLLAHRGPNRTRLLAPLRAHPIVVPVPGGRVRLGFELLRDLQVLAVGAWEPQNVAFMRRHLHAGGVMLDVGAHVGFFTLAAAELVAPTGRVLAFEPAPDNLTRLRANLALNDVESRVQVMPAAVGAASGEVSFFGDGGTAGTEHSMVMPRDRDGNVAFTAKLVTIDEVHADSIDFMKIDVEGAELDVLRGARGALARSPRAALLIELHPWALDPALVLRELMDQGFALGTVDGPGLTLDAAIARFADGGDVTATRPATLP